ncbi:MAG: hypothetical protein WEA56_10040 [Balneolaceae bacterium]
MAFKLRGSSANGTFTGISAIILGIMVRPCCSIPFFLALFGMGSAGVVDLLLPYRHIFLAVSALSFIVSGWMIFRVRGALFNKIFFIGSVIITFLFLFPVYEFLNL